MSTSPPGRPYDGGELDVVASLRLDPLPVAAKNARRFLEQFCRAADLPEEVCQTAALLVSELVTNAILHGGTSATVEVHRPADILRVAVRDDNPNLPAVGLNPPVNQEGGRGLLIVSMLASQWGVEVAGSGKAVWFEVAVGSG